MDEKHVCEMREYNLEKILQNHQNFILSPNFEIRTKIKDGEVRKTLIIFDKENRNLCYTYFYHKNDNRYLCNGCKQLGKAISAKMYKNDENEEYIILSNAKHVCILRPYISEKKEIILQSPDFIFMEATKSGTPKLFIFSEKNKKFCYIFSPIFGDNKQNKYYCLGCEQKDTKEKFVQSMDGRMLKGIVTVFLCKDEINGEYYIRMKDGQKHICEKKKYEPEKYDLEILIPPSNFILFCEKGKKPGSISLAIFHEDDSSLCYKFYYSSAMKCFRCFECEKKKSRVSAKIHVNEDGIEYITVKQKKHLCSPIKVSAIYKQPGVKILKESGLNLKQTINKKKKVDESKILRLPNYELQKNKAGVPNGKLIIFATNDKSQCYSYYFSNCSKYYFCSKCKNKNISVTAKLHKDDETGEQYITLGSREHLCEPIKYEPENENIDSSNFMIVNKNDGTKLTKLLLFTSAEKTLYYEYTFQEKLNLFLCMPCNSKSKRCSAKLFEDKNGKEYIKLLKNNHICSPKTYKTDKFQPKIILEFNNFMLLSNNDGKPNSKLVIFDPQKNGFVYEYNLMKENRFLCRHCSKKHKTLTAEMFEKENGEKYFELSSPLEQHICDSKKYMVEKNVANKILSNSFVIQFNNSGEPKTRLTIFDENDTNYGYDYYLKKSLNTFFCCGCLNEKKKYISAKILTDKNGKQNVELGKSEHCCKIRNFKEKNRIFEDFTFEENGKVIIAKQNLNNKTIFHKFNFDENLDAFYCIKCKGKQRKSKYVIANICSDKSGQEFLFLNDFHCCISKKK
uniref:Uncharacterized protein n=1 Tax=Panagrolaimus davidi TaxID=227884 RepID=A0A914PM74_9BILA